MHESRSNYAKARLRASRDRFLSVDEIIIIKDRAKKLFSRDIKTGIPTLNINNKRNINFVDFRG
jgi:hypothetical protein